MIILKHNICSGITFEVYLNLILCMNVIKYISGIVRNSDSVGIWIGWLCIALHILLQHALDLTIFAMMVLSSSPSMTSEIEHVIYHVGKVPYFQNLVNKNGSFFWPNSLVKFFLSQFVFSPM